MGKYIYKNWDRRRNDKRAKLLKYLLEHPCVDCGQNDLRVLDFDHKDPSQKVGNVTRMALGGNVSWYKIEQEIAKCEIRCSNCHRKKTIGSPAWFLDPKGFIESAEKEVKMRYDELLSLSRIIHGTRSGYIKEVRQGGGTCVDCRKSNNAYTKKQYDNKRLVSSAR